MRHKSILHKIVKEGKSPAFAYEFQSLLFKEMALSGFFDNCNSLAALVVANGSTVAVTDSMLKRRQQLGLPQLSRVNQIEIKKIGEKTGIKRRLREEKR